MNAMRQRDWNQNQAWRSVILFALLAAVAVPVGAQQSNTPAPVVLDLAVDGNHTVGGGIVATLAVMAKQSLERVHIQIVLPAGVQQTAGDAAWEGPMTAGEVRIVELSARLSAPGSKRFLGRVTLPAGSVLTVERTLDVQPAPPAKPKK
jgi:hypothetical protein